MSQVIRQVIKSTLSPRPIGPYSQAIKIYNLVFVSGIIGIEHEASSVLPGPIEFEAKLIMQNLSAILCESGSGLDRLVKTTIMMEDLNDFSIINQVYRDCIPKPYPARSSYQVAKLPLGAKIEMEAIAICGDVKTDEVIVKL